MATDIEVCNMALLKLGADPIAAFNEATDRARMCNALYPLVRQAVLRAHPWNCALKRATLNRIGTAPKYGFDYAYQLPADCLRLIEFYEGTYAGGDYSWKIEGRHLLTDSEACNITYVYDNTMPSTWDSLLVLAVSNEMEAQLAYGITRDKNRQQAAIEVAQHTLQLARTTDAQEDVAQELAPGDQPLLICRE